MPINELEMFLAAWDREAANTVKVLEALAADAVRLPPGSRRPVAG